MRVDTNVQNHEGIRSCRMGKRLKHQSKNKRIYLWFTNHSIDQKAYKNMNWNDNQESTFRILYIICYQIKIFWGLLERPLLFKMTNMYWVITFKSMRIH